MSAIVAIDVIAYADLEVNVPAFRARPIQMKAATNAVFGLDLKYSRFRNLIIAYVWHLDHPELAVSYALSFADAYKVAEQMGYSRTNSWVHGSYVTTRPGAKVQQLLAPFRMTPDRWWKLVIEGPAV